MAPAESPTRWANEQGITGAWRKALDGIQVRGALAHAMPGGLFRVMMVSGWSRNGLPRFLCWFGCS